MTGLGELRHLEQWLTYVRWFGVGFAILSIRTQTSPPFPDLATEAAAWVLTAILAITSLAVWGMLERIDTERGLLNLGRVGFAIDIAVVMSFVWIFSFEEPYVTWALLFILPLEGALRYRMKGAMLAAGLVALFFIPQTFHVSEVRETIVNWNVYIFTVGLAGLIAGVSGTMAENWHAKSLAYERQSSTLAELDRLKDRYLAITSHEIRGPLTAIMTGIETLKRHGEKIGAEKRTRILDVVGQQGRQLARLVDDLMISNELQAGNLGLQTEWVNIEPVIQQALDAAASKRKQHRLEVFIDPTRAEIDASRVVQVVRNLVENAYKYTPETTRVSVTARATDAGLFLEVADDGPGIPAEKRTQLFEAFSRIEETAAGREGVGLGLFVVSQLITAMKGRIDFASSARGTTFGIHIPCPSERLSERRFDVLEGGA